MYNPIVNDLQAQIQQCIEAKAQAEQSGNRLLAEFYDYKICKLEAEIEALEILTLN